MNKNKFLSALTAASLSLTLAATLNTPIILAQGIGNCGDGYVVKDETGPDFTYSGDQVISYIYIKAGSQNISADACSERIFADQHGDVCYDVSGLGTNNVTVIKASDPMVGDSACRDISHVEFYADSSVVEPSPSASPEPSIGPAPTPTSEPEPTKIPEPTATPVATAEPTSTPEATANPTAAPVSVSDPNDGKHSSLGVNPGNCNDKTFEVTYVAEEGKERREEVEVTFKYQGEERKVKTDKHGEAKVRFNYNGEASVYATADRDFPSQSEWVKALDLTNCNSGIGGGEVLGASTSNNNSNGQVLGTSTTALAGTGTFASTMAMASQILAGFGISFASIYSKKAKKQNA